MAIELAQFKVQLGVRDTEVLTASQEAHDGFLAKQKGYVSRELSKSSEGEWVDIVHWKTMEDAGGHEFIYRAPKYHKIRRSH